MWLHFVCSSLAKAALDTWPGSLLQEGLSHVASSGKEAGSSEGHGIWAFTLE